MALLQEFFDESKLGHIFGNSFSTIPDFKFYNHSISQVLANDQKAHLSLKKMASAVKSNRKIFRTLAEPLIDGQILIPQSWPSTSDIMTLVSLGVTGICVVLCILLCIKVRKISTSLHILQEVQHEKVPSFIYNKLVTTNPSNEISQLITEFSRRHASTVVGVIVLVLLLVAVICYIVQGRTKGH